MSVVAVDGPAGSGKSTVARAVARALDLEVLDTGAMYRAVTLAALRAGVDPGDQEAVVRVARAASIDVAGGVRIDGEDATAAIRGPDVTAAVSRVSAHPGVRRELVERQRAWVDRRAGGVVEGRDIGTVVLPDAPVKVFLTARPEVRARRRQADERASAREVGLPEVEADLARRDQLDSARRTAPLRPADDALVLDTSDLDVDAVVRRILEWASERGVDVS